MCFKEISKENVWTGQSVLLTSPGKASLSSSVRHLYLIDLFNDTKISAKYKRQYQFCMSFFFNFNVNSM